VLDYLSLDDAYDVHPHRLDPLPGRGYAQKLALVSAAHQPAESGPVSLPYAVRLRHTDVRKGFVQCGKPSLDPLPIEHRSCERVVADPGLLDLASYHVVELDARHRNLLAGGGDPEEFASMGASRRPSAYYLVRFGYLIFQREAGVGESRAICRHVLFHTLWAVHVSGKARIVENIVTGEEVFCSFEASSGEHLLQPPADEGLIVRGYKVVLSQVPLAFHWIAANSISEVSPVGLAPQPEAMQVPSCTIAGRKVERPGNQPYAHNRATWVQIMSPLP
jgi:hypothetical protein